MTNPEGASISARIRGEKAETHRCYKDGLPCRRHTYRVDEGSCLGGTRNQGPVSSGSRGGGLSSKGLTSPTSATLAQPYVEVMSEIERDMVGVPPISCVG